MAEQNQAAERAPLPPGYALEFSQAEVGVHCSDGRTKWFESSKDAKDWAWEDSAQPRLHFGSRIINRCQADDDDHCEWSGCPQIADGQRNQTAAGPEQTKNAARKGPGGAGVGSNSGGYCLAKRSGLN